MACADSFKDRVGTKRIFRSDASEISRPHSVGDSTFRAYARGTMSRSGAK